MEGNWDRNEERMKLREEHWKHRQEMWKHRRLKTYEERRRGKMAGGLVLILIGVVFLLRQLGWIHFSLYNAWPWALIVIGIASGIKHRFRHAFWWVLILVGVLNLDLGIYSAQLDNIKWPLIIILVGLTVMLRPHRRRNRRFEDCEPFVTPKFTSDADEMHIDVVFGGRKEIITSKNFKGGAVSATFGGAEINLMQADSAEPINIDLAVTFGGVEIIVPSHWEVKNEISPIAGSIEDERSVRTPNPGEEPRVLVLRGSVTFGSVEIKSY